MTPSFVFRIAFLSATYTQAARFLLAERMYGLPLKAVARAELFAPRREALSSRVGAAEAERAAPALPPSFVFSALRS